MFRRITTLRHFILSLGLILQGTTLTQIIFRGSTEYKAIYPYMGLVGLFLTVVFLIWDERARLNKDTKSEGKQKRNF
jgi:hypothetical protein